jgi:hypothetical protein
MTKHYEKNTNRKQVIVYSMYMRTTETIFHKKKNNSLFKSELPISCLHQRKAEFEWGKSPK